MHIHDLKHSFVFKLFTMYSYLSSYVSRIIKDVTVFQPLFRHCTFDITERLPGRVAKSVPEEPKHNKIIVSLLSVHTGLMRGDSGGVVPGVRIHLEGTGK